MERSESLVEFTKALSKFQGEITSVKKTSVNPFFKSKYADLDAIWDVCRKPLSSNGLALVQIPVELEGNLYLETLLIHTSGEYIKGYLALNPKATDPQAVGSAITYARRYAMSAMLGVSADEDDDAEKATARGTQGARRIQAQPNPPSAMTGVCTISGHNSAKLGRHPTLGFVHRLSNGEFCAGVLPQKEVPAEPESPAGELPAATETDPPISDEEALGLAISNAGLTSVEFDEKVLKMPWVEWETLGGTVKSALTRLATHLQQQPEGG